MEQAQREATLAQLLTSAERERDALRLQLVAAANQAASGHGEERDEWQRELLEARRLMAEALETARLAEEGRLEYVADAAAAASREGALRAELERVGGSEYRSPGLPPVHSSRPPLRPIWSQEAGRSNPSCGTLATYEAYEALWRQPLHL